jgi:hypothetical protein
MVRNPKIDELNDAQITVKCVEVGKSMLDTTVGLANYDLKTTRSIADKARFALSIRRGRSIDSEEMLGAISSALKIEFRLLQSEILPEFVDKNWVDIIKDGSRITQVNERIPPIEDILSTLGAEWRESETTDIEAATIAALEELSVKPVLKDSLISELNLEGDKFQTLFDYGQQAAFLGSFLSEEQGKEVVWSPLYWASNPERVAKYLSKRSLPEFKTIGSLTTKIRGYPCQDPRAFIYVPRILDILAFETALNGRPMNASDVIGPYSDTNVVLVARAARDVHAFFQRSNVTTDAVAKLFESEMQKLVS